MSHDRTTLQSEMRACLREELELRRQVSQIKSEPLWWKMATIKVFSRLQERDFNAHGLLVKADELGARAHRFQAMEVDEEEIKRRESLVNKIRIYNKFYTMDHKKIMDSLEISEEQVKSVKQVAVKSEVVFLGGGTRSFRHCEQSDGQEVKINAGAGGMDEKNTNISGAHVFREVHR